MRYYATLGYTPGVLLDLHPFIAQKPNVTVFHGDRNPNQVKSIEKAQTLLDEMGLRPEWVEIERPWDIEACLRTLFLTYRRHGSPKSPTINASGGTEVLNAAATMLGMFCRCPVRYWDRRDAEPRTVDFRILVQAFALEGTRQDIVAAALAKKGRVDVAELAENLPVTAGAVSKALAGLRADGLITVRPQADRRAKTVELSDALWPILLFESTAVPGGKSKRLFAAPGC